MSHQEDDVIICRCQELTRGDVIRAIQEGATTVNGVKKRIRSGMGLCQGKTCERLIAQILAEQLGRNPAELIPPTYRAPVRPIDIAVFLPED